MATEDNKKGFSGLSSKESQIEPIDIKVDHSTSNAQTSNTSSTQNKSKIPAPPSISKVEAPATPIPGLLFLKRYWLWLLIGGSIAWAVLDSNNSSSVIAPLSEEIPPYGSGNVLNSSQIYYCLAEKIRIDANELTINSFDSYSVSKFNGTVGDYNARCSNFKYKSYAMETAQKALELNRYSIQAQGRSRF